MQTPFYKGKDIKFDVIPNQVDLNIGHNSLVLPVAGCCVFLNMYVWKIVDAVQILVAIASSYDWFPLPAGFTIFSLMLVN